MAYLVDTNILVRRSVLDDPGHHEVMAALNSLMRTGETVCITAQNLVEYRALATRPADANGLGYSSGRAAADLSEIEDAFAIAEEAPAIYPLWRDLVDRYAVIGRQVYDARLVAVMRTHGLTHLLTLNARHFRRFREITVVEPRDILS